MASKSGFWHALGSIIDAVYENTPVEYSMDRNGNVIEVGGLSNTVRMTRAEAKRIQSLPATERRQIAGEISTQAFINSLFGR